MTNRNTSKQVLVLFKRFFSIRQTHSTEKKRLSQKYKCQKLSNEFCIFLLHGFFQQYSKNILQILKQFTVCNLQGRVSKFLEVYRILFFKKMSDTIEYSKEIALHIIHFPILEYNEAIYLGKHSLAIYYQLYSLSIEKKSNNNRVFYTI